MVPNLNITEAPPNSLFRRYHEVLGRRRRRGTVLSEEMRQAVMTDLCRQFGSLAGAAGVEPWQPLTFIAYLNRCTSAATQAAGRFVLSVWEPRTNWAMEGLAGWQPFDLSFALDNWSSADRAAFSRWLEIPIWP